MIHITESAAKQLKELASEKGNSGLRLAVEKGGCAGLQYAMSLGGPLPGDEVTEQNGAVVAIDPESSEQLDGCTIDYVDELTGAGFRVINPHASRSCGCGTSFEPAPQEKPL
ncbi:MAG: iron-sulfur cluster assembly accessory protein [Chthoniobacterales bacterium]|jgi:iron-sulfur cluster assembly protein|nr:iron-sulfur cluster assembly accessory protein [Chthoniobacterales bacterium]